jgi:malonate decarboxylase epsilon subunit
MRRERGPKRGGRAFGREGAELVSFVEALSDHRPSLTQALAACSLQPPTVPYMSDRGGRALYDADAIRDDLATSVARPVRWYDALEVLRELGATLFLEMIPGHVSSHLVAKLFPDATAVSITDQGLREAVVRAARLEPHSAVPT